MTLLRTIGTLGALTVLCISNAQAIDMNEAQARAIVAPLYKNFNVPQGDVAQNVKSGTTADWQSCVNDTACRGQEESIKSFSGMAKMLPDVKLEIKEIVTRGDKIVVRGQLSGTPAGDFFGMPHTGKSFKVMTIDIHTIKDGKISHTNHLEDWAGALGQLRAAGK
jgi:predicted ester cyclase